MPRSATTTQDEGYVLVTVMALLLVVSLLSTAVLSSVLGGISTTSNARAAVQSQAAAEAGVDVVLGALASGSRCTVTTSATSPSFTATVSYSVAATTNPYDGSVSWIQACPPANATYVKVDSVGLATVAASGTANTGGNSRSVEAILQQSPGAIWSLFGARNLVG
jgi:type II secretory pathway pseudopilin PulG